MPKYVSGAAKAVELAMKSMTGEQGERVGDVRGDDAFERGHPGFEVFN